MLPTVTNPQIKFHWISVESWTRIIFRVRQPDLAKNNGIGYTRRRALPLMTLLCFDGFKLLFIFCSIILFLYEIWEQPKLKLKKMFSQNNYKKKNDHTWETYLTTQKAHRKKKKKVLSPTVSVYSKVTASLNCCCRYYPRRFYRFRVSAEVSLLPTSE